MLTGLRLGNFKAFGETQNIPIKPLTLIFGANSAGKSSIIQGLLVGCHASETGNLDVYQTRIGGDSVNLGGFRQFIHRRDAIRRLTWGASVDASNIQDDQLFAVFNHAKRNNKYPQIGSPIYNTFAANVKRLGRLDFELGIQISDFVQANSSALSPTVLSYKVFSDSKLLLHLEHSDDGSLKPVAIDYKHFFFETVWDLVAGVEQDIARFNENTISSYDSFFKERNPGFDIQVQEVVAGVSLGMPEEPVYLPIDEEYWDDLIRLYKWSRHYTGLFVPQSQCFDIEKEQEQSALLLAVKQQADPEAIEEVVASSQYFHFDGQLDFEAMLGDYVSVFDLIISPEFKKVNYLGPMRLSPPRTLIALDNQHPSWYAGGYQWDNVRRNSEVRDKVNTWLGKMKSPYQLQVRRYTSEDGRADAIEELILHDQRFDTYVSPKDVGFGISQVLPVLVSAYGSENQIIAIEQPEIHLHPALQAELGDVFIESALGERKNTFLLETHSEHLILRIMRRMRDTVRGTLPEGMPPVRPQDVAILYVDRKDDDSTSVVSVLELDEEGQLLDPWPGGFFEEGFNERFA